MKVSLVLGAGFSYNAGVPMVAGVSEHFTQPDLYNETLNFSSSEWKWRKYAPAVDQHNGRLGGNWLPYSFLLEGAVQAYLQTERTKLLNYEKFYQWLIDLEQISPTWEGLVEGTKEILYERFPHFKRTREDFFLSNGNLIACIIHLIDDLLRIRKKNVELQALYKPYLDMFLNEEYTVNIFTLNHDLLIEKLCGYNDINYSSGFSEEGSPFLGGGAYCGTEERPVPFFNGSFHKRIKLYKLHGSIDHYRFQYPEQGGSIKGYEYYKTSDYNTKHEVFVADKQGNKKSAINWDITAKFVTGSNKFKLIQEDKMYSVLYRNFQEELPKSDRLIIVGYSYSDQHINAVLEQAKDNIESILNINPGTRFPYSHSNVRNVDPLNEAVEL